MPTIKIEKEALSELIWAYEVMTMDPAFMEEEPDSPAPAIYEKLCEAKAGNQTVDLTEYELNDFCGEAVNRQNIADMNADWKDAKPHERREAKKLSRELDRVIEAAEAELRKLGKAD